MATDAPKESHGAEPQRGPLVSIMVDSVPRQVHRGSWRVSELKQELGIDPGRVLDLVVDGSFHELPDDSRITIKGGEVFISHVPQGGAS